MKYKCVDCEIETEDPYYVGEEIVCKDCYGAIKKEQLETYMKYRVKLVDLINDLDREMDSDISGWAPVQAYQRLGDALSDLDKTIENLED